MKYPPSAKLIAVGMRKNSLLAHTLTPLQVFIIPLKFTQLIGSMCGNKKVAKKCANQNMSANKNIATGNFHQ